MRVSRIFQNMSLAVLVVASLCSCESVLKPKGDLEIKKAVAGPVFVLEDFHRANPELESKLAADLRAELAKSGFTIATNQDKAALILLATPGRMKFGSDSAVSMQRLDRSPFMAGGSTGMTRASDVAAARLLNAPQAASEPSWRAGLILTAVERKKFEEFGRMSDSLPHVWRAYASAPLEKPAWSSVSAGLVEAVSGAATQTLQPTAPAKPGS